MNPILSTYRIPSPLGEMLLVANAQGDALAGLYLERQKYFPANAEQWRDVPRLPLFRDVIAQLDAYFAGTLAPVGTAFQSEVWSAIRGVPFGATITYAELARRCGRSSAVRAAGAATGRNPVSVIIPCHRIIGSDGALTGYAGGLDRKRALLALESRYSAAPTRMVA